MKRWDMRMAAMFAAVLCACAGLSSAYCDPAVVDAIRALHPRPDFEFDGMLEHLDKEYLVTMLDAKKSTAGQVPICLKGTLIGEKGDSKIWEFLGFVNGAYSMTLRNGFLDLQDEEENEETKWKSHIVYFTHEVVGLYTCFENDFPSQAVVAVSSWFIGKVDDQIKQVQDKFKQVGIKSFNEIPKC